MEWTAMALLGAYHGINPGMGWLFAVALGLQERSARGVWRALPPMALGHALAVGAVLLLVGAAEVVVPRAAIRITTATLLVSLGAYRLWRHRHPRFGGMQVGFRDLTMWSFLMASAHGAGLMLLPLVIGLRTDVTGAFPDAHAVHAAVVPASLWTNAAAAGIHTGAYFAVTALAAWVVYRRLGLAFLRTAWINLDWLWAGALVATGAIVLVM